MINIVFKKRHLKKTAVLSCNLPSSTRRKIPSVTEADEARLQRRIRRNCQREELREQRNQTERPVMQEEMNKKSPAVMSTHEIPVE